MVRKNLTDVSTNYHNNVGPGAHRLAFVLVCIPVRHALAVFFAYASTEFVGQIFRHAPYGGFGGLVWLKWNRYVHAPLYALVLILLYTRCGCVWTPLVTDLAMALVPT